MEDDAVVFYNIGDVFIMMETPRIELTLDKTKDELTVDISAQEEKLKVR